MFSCVKVRYLMIRDLQYMTVHGVKLCIFHGPSLKYLLMVRQIVFTFKFVVINFIDCIVDIPSVVLLLMVHNLGI